MSTPSCAIKPGAIHPGNCEVCGLGPCTMKAAPATAAVNDAPVTFDFGQALKVLRLGGKVQRQGWNGKDMFLFLVPGSTFTVNRAPLLGIYPAGTVIDYCPHIDMRTADGKIVPWLASQTDVLANDWSLVA
jgi:hypothetical protein